MNLWSSYLHRGTVAQRQLIEVQTERYQVRLLLDPIYHDKLYVSTTMFLGDRREKKATSLHEMYPISWHLSQEKMESARPTNDSRERKICGAASIIESTTLLKTGIQMEDHSLCNARIGASY